MVACVIGDGEAETGPLAGQLALQQVPEPGERRRGAADPAPQRLQDRQPDGARPHPARGARGAAHGYGYRVTLVEGDDPERCTSSWPRRWTRSSTRSHAIQRRRARRRASTRRPRWPMIVLRTPKGWTGPKIVDGMPVEGTWRAHQVPIAEVRDNPAHLRQLEEWMRSYRPEELFDASGALLPELAALAPAGYRRMSANPHANGGLLLRDLELPRLPRLRGRGRRARRRDRRSDPGARRLAARRDHAQPATLPPVRPGRDGIQPARGGLRGHRPGVRRRDPRRATITSRPTAG